NIVRLLRYVCDAILCSNHGRRGGTEYESHLWARRPYKDIDRLVALVRHQAECVTDRFAQVEADGTVKKGLIDEVAASRRYSYSRRAALLLQRTITAVLIKLLAWFKSREINVRYYAQTGSSPGFVKGPVGSSESIHLSLTAEHPAVVSLALFINNQSLSSIKVMEGPRILEEHELLCWDHVIGLVGLARIYHVTGSTKNLPPAL
ncbi:hypothetical protein LTS18_014502, partial [Coniosporium uncinatum]